MSKLPTKPSITYPARRHAAQVYKHLLKDKIPQPPPHLFLRGHATTLRDDTDHENQFRQEANFMYLTGLHRTRGAAVLISLSPNVSSPEAISESDITTTAFLPNVDELEVMWCGLPPSPAQVKSAHPDLSKVAYISELPNIVAKSTQDILTIPGTVSNDLKTNESPELLQAIHEARTIKTPEEIEILRYANQVSSYAHEEVMRALGRGTIKSETEAEAVFVAECKRTGARWQAYEPIFAFGTNASTLHYGDNDAPFDLPKGGLLLVDAGCEIQCYASDITRTIPVGNGGKFSNEAKAIYEIVLRMQQEALSRIKHGADWEEIQLHMHLVAAQGLLKLGILHSGTAEELVEKGVVIPFFPHGVGHFLGIDTHDVGGLPEGRSSDPRIRYLRLRRPLQSGHVVTVEPGLYFNDFLLDSSLKTSTSSSFTDTTTTTAAAAGGGGGGGSSLSAYIDQQVLEVYKPVGGVRIEDNVVVTETGYDNLTTAVKSVADIEALCSGLAT